MDTTHAELAGDRLISADEAAHIMGRKRSSFWDYVKKTPSFPAPAVQGHGFTRWRMSEVQAYIASLGRAR